MNKKNKWNAKHTERIQSLKEPTPNPRLLELSDYLFGDSAIELACGLGGNSLYLARMNYQVQAIDISDIAIDFVKELAVKEGLDVQARVGDLTQLNNSKWLKKPVDLLVITYYLDRALFPVVKELIKKDGYFFMETYYQSPHPERKTVSDQFKLQPKELLTVFADWDIHHFEEDEKVGRQTIFCQKR